MNYQIRNLDFLHPRQFPTLELHDDFVELSALAQSFDTRSYGVDG